jgi:methyl-accepting chemotaxis protein
MPIDNVPTRLATVEKLMQRVAVAEKSQQREIRISIEEARDLTRELAMLTAKLGQTITDIHGLLKDINRATNEVEVKFDGGSF